MDLRVFPDGGFRVLDRNEYDYHRKLMHYPHELNIILRNELTSLIEMKREKFRVSYQFSFYRIDFTITNSSNESFLSYEIEIEINQIKELLKNNNGKINYDEISTVLERFMQNILNLYTATTPESFSFISSKKENKFKNQFGNYLEHNVKSN